MKLDNLTIEDLEQLGENSKFSKKDEIYDLIIGAKYKITQLHELCEVACKITYPGNYGILHASLSDLEAPVIVCRFDDLEPLYIKYQGGEKPFRVSHENYRDSFCVVDVADWLNKGGAYEIDN